MHVRRLWRIRGIVQGVGFRPWVCQSATRLGLSGEVGNDTTGVWIEAEGSAEALAELRTLLDHAPAPASVLGIGEEEIPPIRPRIAEFRIAPSHVADAGGPALAPDLAPCPECVSELFDPADRRYLYPFIACARCGPRYSVTAALPYDRVRTSLVEFPLCPDCEAEYTDPSNRRFHAEAIVCPCCGPQLLACSPEGTHIAEGHAAIDAAVAVLNSGNIVAVHAAGGFQLWVDATRPDAVTRLRERKHRDAKPFAVMVGNLADAGRLGVLSEDGKRLLASAAAPIVLVKGLADSPLAAEVAPGCSTVGLCLPASPLQMLLCGKFGRPVVATSGNLSDEPLCFEPAEAIERLGRIADLLLVHNRRILQAADDSVLHVAAGKPRLIRRARGHAPAPVAMPREAPTSGLAFGGQVKGSLALVRNADLVLSPHLGDQDTVLARERHASTAAALQNLLRLTPAWVACDSHPDYAASVSARGLSMPRLEVQHHHAHLLAVLAEQKVERDQPVLGIIWDGSGYGPDGTIWGGEFLLGRGPACRRVAFFRRFALPGGERAVKEPRRSAFAWLWETLGADVADEAAHRFGLSAGTMGKLCDGAAGTMLTSSVGRLFDAVAAVAGLCQVARYEGEAAMRLEAAAIAHHGTADSYPFALCPASDAINASVELAGCCSGWTLELPELPEMPAWEVDTAPLAAAVWHAACTGAPASEIAARFHQTLVAIAAAVAERAGAATVALGGGCFQNSLLLEGISAELSGKGHEMLIPEKFPANDGGIAAGQAFAGTWLRPPI